MEFAVFHNSGKALSAREGYSQPLPNRATDRARAAAMQSQASLRTSHKATWQAGGQRDGMWRRVLAAVRELITCSTQKPEKGCTVENLSRAGKRQMNCRQQRDTRTEMRTRKRQVNSCPQTKTRTSIQGQTRWHWGSINLLGKLQQLWKSQDKTRQHGRSTNQLGVQQRLVRGARLEGLAQLLGTEDSKEEQEAESDLEEEEKTTKPSLWRAVKGAGGGTKERSRDGPFAGPEEVEENTDKPNTR